MLANGAGSAQAQTVSLYVVTTTVATGFSFSNGGGISVDPAGNIFVANYGAGSVQKLTLSNGVYSAPVSIATGLSYPDGVSVDPAGNAIVSCNGSASIVKIPYSNGAYGAPVTIATGISGTNVYVDGSGNIYVPQTNASTIAKIAPGSNGTYKAAVAIGSGFNDPQGVKTDVAGNVYVADYGNAAVKKIPYSNGVYGAPVAIGSGFTGPNGVAPDSLGNVYVADSDNEVKKIPYSNGVYGTPISVGSGISNTGDVLVDQIGNVYEMDEGTNSVREINFFAPPYGSVTLGSSSTLTLTFEFGTGGTIKAPVVATQGVTGLDFTDAGTGTCTTNGTSYSYASAATCTVAIKFAPKAPGLRMGAVVLLSSSGAVLDTVFLQGTGTGALATYTPGTISTVAGNGTAGYLASQDTGTTAGTGAELSSPDGAAVDVAGNLYIADRSNHRIRKVTAATGFISTVAGNGTAGYNGDGVAATSAELNQPSGAVALDGAGNLYIADYNNQRIRKVTAATGLISTVAGNGTAGYNGDGVAATSAELNSPTGVAVDGAGNLYIGDKSNNRIRKVTASTGLISTVAGNGTAGYNGDGIAATSAELDSPPRVAVDGAGNLYIADQSNNRVRMVTASTGLISTVAGNGTAGYNSDGIPATSAELNNPYGVAVDGAGDLYISENNQRIRKVMASTGFISTVAGNGTGGYNSDGIAATSAELSTPYGVAVDGAGDLYIADSGNNRIREVTAAAASLGFASTNVGSTSTDSPQILTVNNIGNASLAFPIPGAGTNPSISTGFSIGNSSTCPQLTASTFSAGTLASGASCTDLVSFAPTVSGNVGGQLVTTDNTLNVSPSTQTVSLNGTAMYATPTVNALSPTNGTTLGGTVVTITGTNFGQVTAVTFGAVAATSFTIVSNTSITAVAPAEAAGAVYVTVSNPGYSSANSVQYTFVTPVPVVTQISPSYGLAAGGGTITISGSNLNGATAVNFGTVSATLGTITNTSITATIPAGTAAATVDVTVTTGGGTSATSSADQYTYSAAGAYTAPTEPVGTPSATQTAYVNVTTAGMLNAINVLTQGATGLDFNPVTGGTCAVGTAYTVGQVCSVLYSFTPKYPGQRLGAVSLVNSSGTILATAYISGTGTGPLVDFSTSVGADVVTSGLTDSQDVVTDAAGNLYITSGTYLAKAAAGSTTATNYLNLSTYGEITGVAIDGAGTLYVTDNQYAHVLKIVGTTVTPLVTNTLSHPQGIVADGAGNVFFTDQGSNMIYEVPAGATSATVIIPSSGGLNAPTGLALDNAGGLYVANQNGNKVSHVAQGATVATSVAIPGFTLNAPEGLAVDAAGNLYIDDRGNSRFIEVPASGAAPFVLGTQYSAYFMSIDGAGRLYVGDALNHKVFRFDRTTATPLLFPNTAVGGTSGAQNLKLENDGNASLSGASVLPSNANFGFAGGVASGSTPGCGAPVAPGALCNVQATFTPKAVGGLSGSGIITDNSLNVTGSTQTVTLSGTATQGSQTITFTQPASPVTYGVSPITLVATGGASGNAVTFSITSGAAYGSLGGTNNSVLTITGAGTIVIAANQAGNTNYLAATQVTRTVVVNQASKAITFPVLSSPMTVNATATLAAAASNGDPVTYTVTAGAATISGTTMTFSNAGSVTIAANSAATTNYTAAATVSQSVTVMPAATLYNVASTNVGATSTVQTLTVNFANGGTLGSIAVVTQGNANLDYALVAGGSCAVGAMYTAGQACTVSYSFTPKAPGLRAGAVVLLDANKVVLGTSLMNGTGVGPLAAVTAGVAAPTFIDTQNAGDPFEVAADAGGNVFLGSFGTGQVFKYTLANGVYTQSVLASGLSATAGIAVDGAGNAYVASAGSYQVFKEAFNPATGQYTQSVLFDQSNSVAEQNQVWGVTVDPSGNFFLGTGSGLIFKETPNGSGGFTETQLPFQSGFVTQVAVDPSGNLYVADAGAGALYKLALANGTYTQSTIVSGYGNLNGVALDNSGTVYASTTSLASVLRFSPQADGTYQAVTPLAGGYGRLNGLAVDALGNVYVANDGGGNSLSVIKPNSSVLANFGAVPVGTPSVQSVGTLSNLGNAPLAIAGTTSSSTSFALSGGCSTLTTLPVGGACALTEVFTPTGAGAFTGTVSIVDNSLNVTGATQSVPVSGTGYLLNKTISFTTLATPVAVNATGTLTATASNGDPVVVTVTQGAATISGSTITFTNAGTVTITATSAATSTYNAAPPVSQTVTVTPAAYSYTAPTEPVGTTSATQTAYVNITTAGTLNAINVLTKGSPNIDFKLVSGGTCTATTVYSVGQACSVEYSFTPTAAGERIGGITLANSTGTVLGSSYLGGMGMAPVGVFNAGTQSTFYNVGDGGQNGMTLDGAGDLYYTDLFSGTLYEVKAGTQTPIVIATGLGIATDVAVDGIGDIFFGSNNQNTLFELKTGSTTPVLLDTPLNPEYFAVDAAGNLFAAIAGAHVVKEYLANGTTATFGTGLSHPQAIALDASDNIYLTDRGLNEVLKITPANVQTVLASGFGFPVGIAMDPAGNIYVADTSNNAIDMLAAGTYAKSTVSSGWSAPKPLFMDAAGNLYVANTGTGTIIELNRSAGSLSFASTSYGATSAAQQTAFVNIGNEPLAISAVTASTNFAVDASNTCSVGSLASGANCVLAADFAPLAVGPLTGTLTVTDNSLNQASFAQITSLSGTAAQATQSISFTAPASPVTYGTAPIALVATGGASGNAVTFSILSGAAYGSLSGTNNSVLTVTGAGTIVIAANQAGNTNYVAATQVTQTVTVNKATLTAAIIGTPTKTYNGTTAATLTSANYQLIGLVGSDSFTVTQTAGMYAAATAGTQTVTATLTASNFTAVTGSLSNYILPASASGSGAILLANASVKPSVASKTYGAADPTLTGTLSGFVATDNVTATYSRTAGETVGGSPYSITATLSPAAVLSNYNVTYNTAAFTITKANASVTPNTATKTYGTVDPALSGTLTGFLAADSVIATYSRTAGEAVGGSPYSITATLSPTAVLSNYNVTYNTAAFTITKASASVTPNMATTTYGTVDPALSGTLTGFVASDNVTATYSRVAGANVGSYAISAVLSPTAVLANYNVTYNTAQFTITQASASVTPNAATKTYGTADPTLAGTLTGFLASDNVTAIYSRTAGSNVGGYTISAVLSPTAVLANYNITYNTAAFAITQASASVTPNAAAKVFGTSDPTFTGTLTGFLPSDNVTAAYSRVAGENVGSYAISAALSPTAVLANYNIINNTAAFSITPATKAITFPQPVTPVAANSTATLTATASNGDPVTYTVTSGTATISGSTITFTNAGTVTIAADSTATGNYLAAATVSDIILVNPAASAYSAPTTAVGVASAMQTAYVNFTGAGTLGTINVLTQGAAGLDYNAVTGGTCAVGTTYTAGQVCSVTYTFTPTSPGQRNGAVVVLDNNGSPLGTSYLGGTGTAPLGLFTSTQQTLNLGGFSIPRGLSTDGFGNVYVLDTGTNNVDVIPVGTNAATVIATLPNTGSSGATAVDGAGNLFVNGGGDQTIYEFIGAKLPAVAVASTCGSDDNLWIDGAGNLYYSCYSSDTGGIEKVDAVTHATTELFPGNQGYRFVALTVDGAGNVFAPDFNSNTLFELAAGSSTLTPLVSNDGNLSNPHGIALDPAGNIYVTNYSGSNSVMRYAAGSYAFTQLPAAGSRGVVIDGSGNLYTIPDDGTIAGYSRTVAPPLTFADTAVGTTSNSQQTVEYENDGNAPLLISNYAATAPFAITGAGNTCVTGSLASGGTCFIGSVFSPLVVGEQTGTATLTTNSNNVSGLQQTLALSGNGLPGSQTISFGPLAPVVYGVVPFALNATGGATGNPVTFTVEKGSATLSGNVLTITGAGEVVIAADEAGNANYLAAPTVHRRLWVRPAALTATLTGNLTKTYDSTNTATLSAANYMLGGLVNGDSFTVTQTVGTYASANAGPESVTATLTSSNFTVVSGRLSNYTLPTSATGAGTISTATLSTSIIGNPTKTYNGTTSATLSSSNYQLSGLMGTDSFAVTQTVGTYASAAAGAQSVTAILGLSNFAVINGSLSNYTVPASASGPGTITPATASVTSNPATKTYGTADPAFTGTLSGFLPADAVTATYTRTPGETVGGSPYTISATLSPAAALANYNITSNTASFTITKATASVMPNPATKTYGTADPALSGTLSGFLPADAVTAIYTRTPGETVGGSPYTISATLSPAAVLANYNITSNTAPFTITKATASVTPNPATKTYGTADPALTGTLSGFLPADGVTAIYTRTPGETVGGSPYTISATLSPAAVLANYNITSNTAAFTITKATASVTPNPATKTYGAADPAFTGTLSGFLPADGVTAIYTRTPGETVAGSPYTISATLSPGAVLANYNITLSSAPFTITQASASVTPNPSGKTYGTADPVFTGSVTGLLTSDNVVATYSRVAGENVGSYTISATLSPSGVLSNYNLTYNTAPFTITQANASVTPTAATKVYGTADPALGGTLTGFLASDNVTASYSRTVGANVGSYPITAVLSPTAVLSNYTITYNAAAFTITQAGLTAAIVGTPTKTYNGTTAAALTSANFQLTGIVSGDAIVVNQPVGSYAAATAGAETVTAALSSANFVASSGSLANYVLPSTAVGPGHINQATPIITWSTPAAITYGTALSSAQLNATANIAGTFSYLPSSGVLTAGQQTLNVTFTPTDNKNYATTPASVVLTVNKATPVIAWANPAAISYGTLLSATQLNATASVPGTFVYSPAAGALLTGGLQTLTATFTPTDTTDYNTQTKSVTIQVNESTVSTGIASGTQTYQTWTNFVLGPSWSGNYSTSKVPTGTVTLYDNGTQMVKLPLGSNGLAYWTTSPPLNVGTHNLTVSYSGDSVYPPGLSAVTTITVLPASVNFQASCYNGTMYYSSPWQCSVSISASTTTIPGGVFTYSLDGAAPISVNVVPGGSAVFTVAGPLSAGTHKLVLNYAAQGNYQAGNQITATVTVAQGQSELEISPSSSYLAHGSKLTLSGTLTTPNSGYPTGSVTFYDNGTAIGTSTVGANGSVSYIVTSIAQGSHSYSAKYAGSTNYTAVSWGTAGVTAY
jgi:sugar lactone lactonase YvrE